MEGLLRRMDTLADLVRSVRAPEHCRFTLSTVHSAKGLEYDTVYLMDVIDGTFPEEVIVRPDLADADDLEMYEEDRRVFYVGMTRAKNRLMLFTYADERSAFCDEIFGRGCFAPAPESGKAALQDKGRAPAVEKESLEQFCARLSVGARVRHRVFGEGTVLSCAGDEVSVRFSDGKPKRLSLKFLYSESLLTD
jgi:DNA helicase-2/ATP-dependent DNA helicase PcrA